MKRFRSNMAFGISSAHKDCQNYYDLIINTDEVIPTDIDQISDSNIHFSQIINGLYLGNRKAFLRACHPTEDDQAADFNTVITACPLSIIYNDPLVHFGNPQEKSADEVMQLFQERNITWLYVGKMMIDDPLYWHGLAYDCTFLDTDLAQEIFTQQVSKFNAISKKKYDAITNMQADKWFEPIFAALDEAVFGNKQVLVHCHQGVSRSATIIAAYLIHRFGVTSKQAINYLTSKRFCVNPKFSKALDNYYWLLKHMY